MTKLILYRTISAYQEDFEKTYTKENFKLVRLISLFGLILSLLSRLIAVFFLKNEVLTSNFDEYERSNLILLYGHTFFYAVSFLNFKYLRHKQLVVWLFVFFILLSSFYVSYVNSMHNTKNTLTILGVGVVITGLFFVLELRTILLAVIILMASFWFGIVGNKISFFEKVLNICAGLTLGFLLLFISRYSYYLKSKNFVKIKQLEEKNHEIAMLNRQKNDVLAYVAHDLRSPLVTIHTLNQFDLDVFSNEEKSEMIDQAVQKAESIIADLLDVLRVGETILDTENVDLSEYLVPIVNKWTDQSKREIVLRLPKYPVYAALNRIKMERVLDNLIQNALKFSSSEKVVSISLSMSEKIKIAVLDEGIGIPKELTDTIFDQFTSAGRTGLQGEKSVGIGMHLSKKIVELHNGTLAFKSEEGKGTEFIISLEKIS